MEPVNQNQQNLLKRRSGSDCTKAEISGPSKRVLYKVGELRMVIGHVSGVPLFISPHMGRSSFLVWDSVVYFSTHGAQ